MQTLRVTHKHYSVFEIYHVKSTNLVQSYTWPHFSVHCVVKSHVYHVKYTDFISIPYLCSLYILRVTHIPYCVFEI